MYSSPGQRMLEHAAHAMISDNARGIAKTTLACDQKQQAQRQRFQTLQSLHDHQVQKKDLLSDRLKSRASHSTHGGLSNRHNQDIKAGIAKHVAASKDHERQRAAKHRQLLKAHDSARDMYEVRADEDALTLTLELHPQHDGCGDIICYSIAGESKMHFKFHDRTTLSDVKGKIAYNLKEPFRLVTRGGTDISGLPGQVLVRQVDLIESSELGALELADADEPLPAARVRNLKRKCPNAKQLARKSVRRSINKAVRKAEHRHFPPPATTASFPPFLASKSKAPPPAAPRTMAMRRPDIASSSSAQHVTRKSSGSFQGNNSMPIGARTQRKVQTPIGANPNMFLPDKVARTQMQMH